MDSRSCIILLSMITSAVSACRDRSKSCFTWASKDYCTNSSYATYMRRACKKSCGFCHKKCRNKQPDTLCESWKRIGECERNPGYMLKNCRRSCKRCEIQPIQHPILKPKSHSEGSSTHQRCQNKQPDASCNYWKTMGECERIPRFMLKNCKKSCEK